MSYEPFFRSRWVQRPEHVRELAPTALPEGYRSAGIAAGIKREGPDVGLLVSDRDATVSAARFTSNALVAAPVAVARAADLGSLRALAVNSGNANVSDGRRGVETAEAQQRTAAEVLDLEPGVVGIASTGVIGRELPRDKLVAGIRHAAEALGPSAQAFSESILTTDRGPKCACLEVTLPSGATVRLAAQAKGGGMISPNFATMLCFVQTDAGLAPETVDLLTGVCVKRSFDRISVDGQLSTNDAVFCMANGASGVEIEPESQDELALGEAFDALLRQLAIEMVADGEGAQRVGRVTVRGGMDLVEPVARAVADSPLVKTALLGADPNFGRILQAAGQAMAGRAPFVVDLAIEGRQVVSAGTVVELEPGEWEGLEQDVAAPEVEFELTVPGEGGETEVFFSDLTHDYVTLNADYST
ncbi:MAG: bifunctional ornithine acetyltransferase/N-acetylglutamate synthase [Thermoleophilaceae bacterium]|nr:bifunctional ornithine acetyltransferase/N-acetylglutamate synthase [Thermoleophilaceae bacterium]